MNAHVLPLPADLRPLRPVVPAAALARLRQHLGQASAYGEVLEVALGYGVSPDTLRDVIDYWRFDFELESTGLDAPGFASSDAGGTLCFTHARSSRSLAMPLLLLHGYSGSPAEFRQLLPELAAFHVVCPALPGFGLSTALPDLRAMAAACAGLMKQLGYSRYLVHGADLGANLALELADVDRAHVAALHVTSLPSYPGEDPFELASLTRQEKSQLAGLADFRDRLDFGLPTTPLEGAAFALMGLDEPENSERAGWLDALLTGLTWAWTLSEPTGRNELMRGQRLAPAPLSTAPIAVHTFPLDAPSLRRLAESRHRVVEWREHATGGCMPALEQPRALQAALHEFFARFA